MNKQGRLSNTEVTVLRQFAQFSMPVTLRKAMDGIGATRWGSPPETQKNAVRLLRRYGYIVDRDEVRLPGALWPDWTYIITAKGRAYLASLERVTPTIPGDDTLADHNAAAEQREEWADYGDETADTTWLYPTAPVMLCRGWRVVAEEYVSKTHWYLTWHRYPLLSADYA